MVFLRQNHIFLSKIKLFDDCSLSMIEQFIQSLKITICLPETPIINAGDDGDKLYFITKGICDVIINGFWVSRLKEGEYFGEIALLSKSNKRTANVRTATYVDLFYVVKEKFDEILADHSIDAHFLLKKAKISFLKNIELMDPKMLDKMYISNKGIRVKNIWRKFDKTLIIDYQKYAANVEEIEPENVKQAISRFKRHSKKKGFFEEIKLVLEQIKLKQFQESEQVEKQWTTKEQLLKMYAIKVLQNEATQFYQKNLIEKIKQQFNYLYCTLKE